MWRYSACRVGVRHKCSRAILNMLMPPNYAFERTGEPSARARVRPSQLFTPSARLKRLRPAAQRER